MNPEPKRAGCCTWCNAEVFEVKTYFPDGPLARFPRKIGKPLPTARRIDYVLLDGSRGTVTACEACVPNLTDPQSFPAIWAKIVQAFLFEERPDVRAALPAPPRSAADASRILTEIDQLAKNPPIGVLAALPFSD